MRNKIKFKSLILLTLTALVACSLTACKIGKPDLDDIKEQQGVDPCVTYYANGGMFGSQDTIYQKDLYFKVNTPIINVTEDTSVKLSISRTNMKFDGWYFALRDSNGDIIYKEKYCDADKCKEYWTSDQLVDGKCPKCGGEVNNLKDGEKVVAIDESKPVDFSRFIQAGEHYHIGAKWITGVKFKYVLSIEEGKKITLSDGVTEYKNGDVLKESEFTSLGTLTPKDVDPLGGNHDWTYLDIFLDEECTTSCVDVKFTRGDEDTLVYVKYVEGSWKVVKDDKTAREMFNNLANSEMKFYVYKDIVMENRAISPQSATACHIEGNGHTISGLTFNKQQITNGSKVAIFGELKSTARINNITLSNVNVSYGVRGDNVELYALFSKADETATLQGVTVSGITVTMVVPKDSTVTNVKVKNALGEFEYKTDKWLVGGFGSDAEFASVFTGATVENAVLKIGTLSTNVEQIYPIL